MKCEDEDDIDDDVRNVRRRRCACVRGRLAPIVMTIVVACLAMRIEAQPFDFRTTGTATFKRYDFNGQANLIGLPLSAAGWGSMVFDQSSGHFQCSETGGAWFTCFAVAGGGSSTVTSVFGRTGAVVATYGDYPASLIPITTPGGLSATDVQGAINQLAARGAGVSSVFGRTGTVTPQTGDYSVAQVTGAAPLASPAFTGTPTAPTAAAGTATTQIATTSFVSSAVATGAACATCVTTNTTQTITAPKTITTVLANPLTITRPTAATGTVTVAAAGTTITGTGTNFLTYLIVGENVTLSNGEVKTIATVTSDTVATSTIAFTNACTNCTYTTAALNSLVAANNGVVIGGTATPTPTYKFRIFTSGTERFHVNENGNSTFLNGNVGIGADAVNPLGVYNNSATTFGIYTKNSSTTGPSGAFFDNWASTGNGQIYYDNAAARFAILTSGSVPFAIGTNGVPARWVLDVNGAVLQQSTGTPSTTVETTDNTTTSLAQLVAKSNATTFTFNSHAAARTVSRFGLTLGGWAEILAQNNTGTNNGLVIGTLGAVPLVFGTNNIERMRIDGATSSVGVSTTTTTMTNGYTSGIVLGGSYPAIRFLPSGAGAAETILGAGSSGQFSMITGAGFTRFTSDAQNRVGVGVASPVATLDIRAGTTNLGSATISAGNGPSASHFLSLYSGNATPILPALLWANIDTMRFGPSTSPDGTGFVQVATLDNSGNLGLSGGIAERGRAAQMGVGTGFTPVWTASAGTITSSGCQTQRYTLVGKQIHIAIYCASTLTLATASAGSISFTIPGGFTSQGPHGGALTNQTTTLSTGSWTSNVTTITLYQGPFQTGTWPISTINLMLDATFEVQ